MDNLGKFYVYHTYGMNNELLYVGKGSGERWKHCNSGISSNKQLNRYYFQNGEGDCIKTQIEAYFDTEEEALHYEKASIKDNKPMFNSEVDKYLRDELTPIQRFSLGHKVNFRQLAENYYEAKVRLKGCEDSSIDCTIEDINSFKATIETCGHFFTCIDDYLVVENGGTIDEGFIEFFKEELESRPKEISIYEAWNWKNDLDWKYLSQQLG